MTLDEMKVAAFRVLRAIQSNVELIRSFFRLEDTEYAANQERALTYAKIDSRLEDCR